MAGFSMDDYATVAERIVWFKEKHPDGSLQATVQPREQDGFLVGWFAVAYAYRTPDDPRPGKGTAYEPVPGKTPYTRDSEAMNAETSAWGRAINALGFPTKKLASREEVEARQQDPAAGTAGPAKRKPRPEAKKAAEASAAGKPDTPESEPPDSVFITADQRSEIWKLQEEIGVSHARMQEIFRHRTGQVSTKGIPVDKYDLVKGDVLLEGAPFE